MVTRPAGGGVTGAEAARPAPWHGHQLQRGGVRADHHRRCDTLWAASWSSLQELDSTVLLAQEGWHGLIYAQSVSEPTQQTDGSCRLAEHAQIVLHHDSSTLCCITFAAEEEARSPSGSAASKLAPQMPTPFLNTSRGLEPESARACALSQTSYSAATCHDSPHRLLPSLDYAGPWGD